MSEQIVSASSETFAEIQAMQGKIDEIEGMVLKLIERGDNLANNTNWRGNDATRWRDDWTQETSPKLKTTLEVLRSISANAKDSASNIMTAGGNLDFG